MGRKIRTTANMNPEEDLKVGGDCSKFLEDDHCDVSEEDISLALEYDDEDVGCGPEIHERIENLYQKIEEKQKMVQAKREELRSLEVDSDVEVFEMKHEIVSLQSKIEDDEGSFKKLIGKGWRNSVMQRRIYGRLTKSAKKEAEDWDCFNILYLNDNLLERRQHMLPVSTNIVSRGE